MLHIGLRSQVNRFSFRSSSGSARNLPSFNQFRALGTIMSPAACVCADAWWGTNPNSTPHLQRPYTSSLDFLFPLSSLLHFIFLAHCPPTILFNSFHEFADAGWGPQRTPTGCPPVPAGGWLPWLGPESEEALRLKLATSVCDCWLDPLALFSEAELKVERAGGSKTWSWVSRRKEKTRPGPPCDLSLARALCRSGQVGADAGWGLLDGGAR